MRYCFINIILYSLTFFSTLKAQDDEGLISVADKMYEFGDKRGAQEVYFEVLKNYPDNAKVNLMIGICYLETIHKNKASSFLEKSYEISDTIRKDIFFLLGRSLQYAYKFDKAIEFYEKYKFQYEDNDSITELIDKKIYECNNGKEFVAKPVDIAIHNLGHINSDEADYAPVISADETVLIFTSRREGSTGENKDIDNLFFEDIYVSIKKDHRWSKPVNIGYPINTNYHDASVGLSADGKRLYIYQDNEFGTGGIFYCDLKSNDLWSKPKPLTAIKSEYIENSANITADSKILYFSSNRPGGYGGLDIYVCIKNEKNNWGKPMNLGPTINTKYNEDNPFPDIDGKTLYFSSTGHKGMGDYDIFKAVFIKEEASWTEPENMGYPINSPDADIHFVLSGDGRYAYYSSIKDFGVGEQDLYILKMPERSSQDEILTKLAAISEKTTEELKEELPYKEESFEYYAKAAEKINVKKDLLKRVVELEESYEGLPGLPQILLDALDGISFDDTPLFKQADLDSDQCITTEEIYMMIDIFLDGMTNYTTKQIVRLIDFYFEQDC